MQRELTMTRHLLWEIKICDIFPLHMTFLLSVSCCLVTVPPSALQAALSAPCLRLTAFYPDLHRQRPGFYVGP